LDRKNESPKSRLAWPKDVFERGVASSSFQEGYLNFHRLKLTGQGQGRKTTLGAGAESLPELSLQEGDNSPYSVTRFGGGWIKVRKAYRLEGALDSVKPERGLGLQKAKRKGAKGNGREK